MSTTPAWSGPATTAAAGADPQPFRLSSQAVPYNTIIYLLLVILILATKGAPETPPFAPALAGLLLAGKGLLYTWLVRRGFRRAPALAAAYFAAEQRYSILALLFFGLDIYLLELKYYFAALPGAGLLPSLADYGGIMLFLAYLLILWSQARPLYGRVFGTAPRPGSFLATNLKLNLAVLLPWLLITLLADLLALIPGGPLAGLLASPWGEPLLILLFFLALLLVFPAVIVRLWGCRPLPPGRLRQRIEEFCRAHRIKVNEIMLWPLFEGRLLTAGVIGITGRCRYLLLTPALLEALSPEELDAVVAHEIGHIRLYHLPLYLLFFLAFGLLAQFVSYPFFALVLGSETLYRLVEISGRSPLALFTVFSSGSLILLLLLYFRFLFGFFMRNFERQADLYALGSIGRAAPLVAVFEKIARLSGNIRDLPSWHHFSIGQRIDYLLASERDPRLIGRHQRKVYGALALFLGLLAMVIVGLGRLPPDLLEGAPKARFAEALVLEKHKAEPANPLWPRLLGDLLAGRQRWPEAVAAYEAALALAPEQAEVLNNLAWLLLTADEPAILDRERALRLAEEAAARQPSPYILDTLATAYWANGRRQEALALLEQLWAADPGGRAHYQAQRRRFQGEWPENR